MKQKVLEIAGVKYTLQHPGIRWYHDTNAECAMKNGFPNQLKMFRAYLEHVVVEPGGTRIKDFDDLKGSTKAVKIYDGEDEDGEEKFIEFTIKHPGIVWILTTTSKNMLPNGIPHPALMRKEIFNKMVEDENVNFEYFDKLEYGYEMEEELINKCQDFMMGGRFEELQELVRECDTFLTKRRTRQ